MIRTTAAIAMLAVVVLATPALAQDSLPSTAMFSQIQVSIPLLDPEPTNGQGCSGPMADAARAVVDPITEATQAEPIVAIPLTGASGTLAWEPERDQRAHTCEQERTQ